ncbi:acyl carrier protein [Kitasatospora sp. NPDC088391]|uniref:acyl carrier protein n=1 Tax=Kitasatospora sp. NPDC088391 TaxID=3364074 RepID=UPI003811EFF5
MSGRDEVVSLLAEFGGRAPEEVPERIDSMELAWLAHVLEQRHGRRLDDDTLARIATVADAAALLESFRTAADR